MLFSGLNQEVRKEEYICMCSVQIVNICYQQSSKGIQHKSIKKITSDKVFHYTNSEFRMRKINDYCKEYTDVHTRRNKLEELKICVKSHCNYRDIV